MKLYMFATDGGSSRLWWEGSRAVGRLWRAELVTKLSASVRGSDQGSLVSSGAAGLLFLPFVRPGGLHSSGSIRQQALPGIRELGVGDPLPVGTLRSSHW